MVLFFKYLHFWTQFLIMQKNGLVRKLWSVSKFIRSRTGQQIITIYMLPNISLSKGIHAMKFCLLIKFRMRNIFLQKSCRKWGRQISSRPLFVFKKSFTYGKKQLVNTLVIRYWQTSTLTYNKNKPYNISDF